LEVAPQDPQDFQDLQWVDFLLHPWGLSLAWTIARACGEGRGTQGRAAIWVTERNCGWALLTITRALGS